MRSLLIFIIALQSVLPQSSEKLIYEVRYKLGVLNTKVATGVIPLTQDTWEGKDAFRSDARITVQPVFKLFMMRDINLEAGETCQAKTYLGGGFRNVRITMQGTDSERFKGRKADYFIIQTPERGLMENGSGNIIKLWRAHDGTRPVLGLEVPLSKGTMICNLKNEL